MPGKLKKLLIRPFRPNHRKALFDPRKMLTHQRLLTYGGALGVSVFILFCLLLAIRMETMDYVSNARYEFLIQRSKLTIKLQIRRTALMRAVMHAEGLWNRRIEPSPELLSSFDAHHGYAVLHTPQGAPAALALGIPAPDRPASAFAPYLALLETQLLIGDGQSPLPDDRVEGYSFSPDGTYLSLLWSREDQVPEAFLESHSASMVIGDAMHGIRYLRDASTIIPLRADRRIVWLPPHPDPLTGKSMIRIVQPAIDATGKLFAIYVRSLPTDMFYSDLNQASAGSTFTIVDRKGNIIIGSSSQSGANGGVTDSALSIRSLSDGIDGLVERYQDGMFVTSDQLPGTDWVLVHAYSWKTIAAALMSMPRIALMTGLVVGIIGMLWIFAIQFDRKGLIPNYRRAQRLLESEVLNRTILRTAPVGLGLLSAQDGSVLLQNNAMLELSARTGGEPLHIQLWKAYRNATARPDSKDSALLQHDLAIERDESNPIYLQANVVAARYRGVNVQLCTLLDISLRKESELKLEEARIAADQANKAKSTFLATMSHEIRTPLNAIIGNLELLRRSPLSMRQSERLQVVESCSNALLHIINDILDLSKVESGQMTLENIPFDIHALLQDIVDAYAPLAESKGLELFSSVGEGIANYYSGDPARIHQILSNLIGNAIKFTDSGHISIDVHRAKTGPGNSAIEIWVSDTGIGIQPDRIATLFDVYTQADASIHRRFGGSGLGLPLCQRLATIMGGSIEIDSLPEFGTTVTVVLPLHEARQAAAMPNVPTALHRNASMHARASLHVLVAEDHPANRALLRDQLEALDHRVDVVENGRDALRAFSEHQYDAVLTDLGMPELDGFGFAMFANKMRADVPIIAMTAHATAEDYQRSKKVGIAEIVLKPLSLNTLDKVLQRHAARMPAAEIHADAASGPATAEPRIRTLPPAVAAALRTATLQSVDKIGQALTSRDFQTVREQLHSIKGGFALTGNRFLIARCTAVEEIAEIEDLDTLRAAWRKLESLLLDALERL
ncbi:ATP-binding protein [Burkholderia oklahomensis]|uniref:ATP-binding protein n=1 Tax=Burkholderia oklahomensis TaxID=342113 RepID=UPI0004742854|nr:ATP-binding protein [Burkholderia oklahomensis]AJX33845.1 his Kinase A domain protein [Burkholderia oklahomensis C6786]AOI47933.1 hybrid sensor histidine kinase/response regulator [Burkholderia oklahomensis C6786]KUY50195.1 hybrid sensor histidine kinase/response regulator [Burkholderia oklahomensis C6786]MBI0363969.1 response regulator [Burkholderia oklahomensis]SUY28167.1 Sensor kinase protein RcsC [Burkholderia oklahomensis]